MDSITGSQDLLLNPQSRLLRNLRSAPTRNLQLRSDPFSLHDFGLPLLKENHMEFNSNAIRSKTLIIVMQYDFFRKEQLKQDIW
jgi:hypothetical protein